MLQGLGLLLFPLLSACWKDDYATLPADTFQFQPAVDAPPGWIVQMFEVNTDCPDGEDSRFYLLYPQEAAASGEPLRTAILFHSGGFDYVFAPEATDPLAGVHFAVPSRLGREFSARQVFATLGMYPSQIQGEDHLGLLPAVLAEHDVAVMMPANCWGDVWHNKPSVSDNDIVADHFLRQGLTAAEWATLFVVDPAFAAAFDVELPIVTDPAQTYLVGLGEGGRAAAELLALDSDADGQPDHTFAGALVDSPPDDLRIIYDDPGLYASLLEGLDRIFPPGVDATASGSFWAADLPPRMGYAAPVDDPVWPDEVHDAAYTRIEAAGGWVVREESGPLQLDGSDVGLVEQAVAFLLGES
jgi:hypothetical protein